MNSTIKQKLIWSIQRMQKIMLFYNERKIRLGLNTKKIVFNIDLHISVVRDLEKFLKNENIKLINWSISGANFYKNRFFLTPLPVDVINSESWTQIDQKLIERFNLRYKEFLNMFDGFISCYPPAFNQLYQNYDKPKLVVAATRYEYPYTNKKTEWSNLNTSLKNDKNLVLAANNIGDKDYLAYYTGLAVEYLPSLCDYTEQKWHPKNDINLIFSKSKEITKLVEEKTSGKWRDVRSVFGRRYSYRDLMTVKSVLFIPYNISIMTLFELSTAGVPVFIPERKFLLKLKDEFPNVLSEISFYQILNMQPDEKDLSVLNKYNTSGFYDWWLDRADFYNKELMPNVYLIESFNQLSRERKINIRELENRVQIRNETLRIMRQKVLLKFTDKVQV